MANPRVEAARAALEDQEVTRGVQQEAFKQIDTCATAKMFFFSMVGILHLQKYTGEFDFSQNCKLFLKTLSPMADGGVTMSTLLKNTEAFLNA